MQKNPCYPAQKIPLLSPHLSSDVSVLPKASTTLQDVRPGYTSSMTSLTDLTEDELESAAHDVLLQAIATNTSPDSALPPSPTSDTSSTSQLPDISTYQHSLLYIPTSSESTTTNTTSRCKLRVIVTTTVPFTITTRFASQSHSIHTCYSFHPLAKTGGESISRTITNRLTAQGNHENTPSRFTPVPYLHSSQLP
jgi:hypothetical protein